MHPCKRICDITGYEVCGSLDKMWYYRYNQREYLVWMFDPDVNIDPAVKFVFLQPNPVPIF